MLRQAAVQRLTDPSANAGKTVERLRDFTDGAGKGVANALFNPEELGHLHRFSNALAVTTRTSGPRGQEMSGPAAKALAKALDVIAGMVAFKVGGIPAVVGTYGAKVGQRAVIGGIGSAAARRSFEGGAPRVALPGPALPTGRLATGAGLYAEQ